MTPGFTTRWTKPTTSPHSTELFTRLGTPSMSLDLKRSMRGRRWHLPSPSVFTNHSLDSGKILSGEVAPFPSIFTEPSKEVFPDEAARVTPDTLWHQMNRVAPTLIRVEADEVMYTLHVVIRMLVEEELIEGSLSVDTLPERWNFLLPTIFGN